MSLVADKKLQEIIERRKFTNFWECLDYLKLASYTEINALMIAMELFDIWDGVISLAKKDPASNKGMFMTGGTTTFYSGTSLYNVGLADENGRYFIGVDPCEPDDLIIKVFIMTKEANSRYKELYKSYIETREYEPIPELEPHFKCVTMKLETQLGVKLFNEGFTNLK